MASIIELKVNVEKTQLKTLEADIARIKKLASEITIGSAGTKSSNIQATTNQLVQLEKAMEKRLTAEKKVQAETAKTATQNAKLATAEAKLATAVEKTNREKEKTAQTENKLAIARERTIQSANRYATQELKVQQALAKTEQAVNRTRGTWERMFSMFSLSNIVSTGVTMAIVKMRQYFNEALSQMKQLDTALSHYRQVTGTSEAVAEDLGRRSYSTASKYGTEAADYAESVATYARAGYAEMSEELAELSLKTVIVGQTTQEIADQFLLTMDAAYQYEGSVSKLSKVLDGASKIDSTYATTLEKIASGLGLVAPLAAQVHVSEAELTAAIGTITATTQRSGSESARALRSLFLNIIKDTTTEIEEGVTATEESVADMQFLLNRYAKSAVDAAEASGQVIDPMEAIGALAQSMKDGLLTEQQLMDMMSSLGGKLRVSQLVALVTHWDDYLKMLNTYEDSIGSADEKTRIYLDSWEAKTNILKNTWTEFIAKTLSTNAMKGIIDGFTLWLRATQNLGNGLIALAGVITTLKFAKTASDARGVAKSFNLTAQAARLELAALAEERAEALRAGDTGRYLALMKATETQASEAHTAQLAAESAAQKALAFTIGTVLVSAVMAAVTAYNMWYANRIQQLDEERERADQVAEAEIEQAKSVEDAYAIYYNARKKLSEGKDATEEYQKAVENLTTALGYEKEALDEAGVSLDFLSWKEVQEAKRKAEEDVRAAHAEIETGLEKIRISFNPVYAAYSQNDIATDPTGMPYEIPVPEEEKFNRAIARYKELIKTRDDFLAGRKNVSEADYKQATAWLSDLGVLGDAIESYLSRKDDIIELDEILEKMANGSFEDMSVEDIADSLELTGENAKEAATSFGTLADAVEEAEGALARYAEQTAKGKDENYKKYADAWKAAFEDIQKGFINSANVLAALDLFFTPEQLLRMEQRGIKAAEVIADPFWQSIFTYVDEKGATQFINDDAGAMLAYKLYDDFATAAEDGTKVIAEKNGNIAASFEEVDGKLKITVTDFEALSRALMENPEIDTSISPDFLAVMLESLGNYSTQIVLTTEDLKALAQETQALSEDGVIDLEKLIRAELDLGRPTQEVINLKNAIIELLDSEEGKKLSVKMDDGSVSDIETKLNGLIATRDDFSEEEAVQTPDVDTSQAEKKFSLLESLSNWWSNLDPTSTAYLVIQDAINGFNTIRNTYESVKNYIENTPIVQKIKSIVTKTESANGQRNFKGGLSLINEKGPELIVEGDSARIAGAGQPTLTFLEKGADVYTAKETKAILGSANLSDLFDGIGAYAGGTADGIVRPTYNQPPADNGGETYDNSGETTPTQPTKPTKTDKDKDAELDRLKEIVELRKAELELLKEQGASVADQEKKQQQIIDALKKQYEYMKTHGGSKKELVKLETEILKAEKEKKKFELERLKDVEALRKSELELLETQDASVKKRIQKQRQINSVLEKELKYMKKIGSSQEDINKVKEEQLKIQKEINDLEQGLVDDLEDAIKGKIERINKLRDSETEPLQAQIDALKKVNEEEEKATELAEKQLAVDEAKAKLENAKAERTVRYFNMKTGKWGWKADANAVASAKEEYNNAKKDLSDYKTEQKKNDEIAAIERRIEKIENKRNKQAEEWQKILDSLAEPVISINKALKNIEKNATKDMKPEIKALNKLLKPLGYQISTKNLYDSGGVLSGIGGIKATANDEVILPPDITMKMLTPMNTSVLSDRMSELRYLYGMTGGNLSGITNNSSIGSQHYGDLYTFGNITLTEAQARSTTIYDLVQKSRGLRAYSAM